MTDKNKTVIKGTDIVKYYGETKVLDDINIEIKQGESIAVIGHFRFRKINIASKSCRA